MGKQSLRSQQSYIKISFHLSAFYRYLCMYAIENYTDVSHYRNGHSAVTDLGNSSVSFPRKIYFLFIVSSLYQCFLGPLPHLLLMSSTIFSLCDLRQVE